MFYVKSKWAGDVISACFRCNINQEELAKESGVSRSFLNKYLGQQNQNWVTSSKIEHGLQSCIEKRGYKLEDFFPV